MVDVENFTRYLPINSGIPEVNVYQKHHLEHLQKCLENKLYSSAYFHVHVFYMLFIYLQLFRISQEYKQQFSYSLIGFPNEERSILTDSQSPFSFWSIREKTIFRFFRLIGFDDGAIGNLSSCVDVRNKHLHVNGEITCGTEEQMDEILYRYERSMEEVVRHSQSFIEKIYDNILLEAVKEEGIEPNSDEIELNFLLPGLFSYRELEFIKARGLNDVYSSYIVQNY